MRRLACTWFVLLVLACPCAAEDIVIGMTAAFSGSSRGLGVEVYRGAMAWFSEVNRTGGVHGRNLVLRAYDDKYTPSLAVANTQRLIQQDRALLLFGCVGTPTVTRILPLLKAHEKESIYLFCPITGASVVRHGPYASSVFNFRASYEDETAGLVDHFIDIGRSKIAVFYQIDAFGRSGWDGVRRALARHQRQIRAEATYRRGAAFSQSMRRQVEILRAAGPDAVICIGAYAACAAFIRDARDANWEVPIANVSFVSSENLLSQLLQHGKQHGVDYTRDLINSQVVPSYTQTDVPAVRLYRDMMERHKPLTPKGLTEEDYQPLPLSFTSFEGFLAARLVVEVLKKLGPDLDKRRLPQTVASLHALDLGLADKLSFGPDGRQGQNAVFYTTIHEGRSVPLTDWTPWK